MSQIAATSDLPAKFCFFIDGLDEFDGDHFEVCQTIKTLCRSPSIKACISSRPWNVFEENLGDDPGNKLYIHELTRDDIRDYVEENLCGHPRWNPLGLKTTGINQFIEEVTNRAQGVFLWVHLVTKLLREGLTNYDSITDLWKRLESLPSDLESFFKHSLNSVEPFYHEKMAGTLLIATAAQKPLPLTIYSFHDMEYENESYAIYELVDAWDQETINTFNEPLAHRLSSRCKGLLEIRGDNVEFLHRTASDFLRSSEIEAFITTKTRGNFDPRMSIFQAYDAWIKHSHLEMVHITDSSVMPGLLRLVAILDTALLYAQRLDINSSSKPGFNAEDLLDGLELAVEEISRSLLVNARFKGMNVDDPTERESYELFRRCALRSGLDQYIRQKMDLDGEYLKELKWSPLQYVLAFHNTLDGNQAWSLNRLELLHYLLAEGYDPNQVYSYPKTPWSYFVERMTIPPTYNNLSSVSPAEPFDYATRSPGCRKSRDFIESLDKGIFDILLKFNTDPNATIEGIPIWARYMLSAFLITNIDKYTDKFIHVLDKMLSKANFEAPAEGIQNIVQASFKRKPRKPAQKVSMGSALGIFKEPSRTSMMKLLWMILNTQDELECRKTSRSHHQGHMLSRAISTFLKHANDSQLPSHILQKKLRDMFPITSKRPRDQDEDRVEGPKKRKHVSDRRIRSWERSFS